MVLLLLQCEVYGFLNKDQDVPKVNINKGTPPLGNENKKTNKPKKFKKANPLIELHMSNSI